MDVFAIIASILGVIYVVLAIKNNRLCFLFGFFGACVWGYADLKVYNLKFDAILQAYYAVMSIVGYFLWNNNNQERPIQRLNIKGHLIMVVLSGLLAFGMYHIVLLWTTSEHAVLDALTTAISILATIILSYRYIDNWIYLFIANLTYIYIYWMSGAYEFVGMMIFYSVMSIIGYTNWLKLMKK